MFLLTRSTHRMVIQRDPDVGHRFTSSIRARIPSEDGGYFVVTNSLGFRSDHEFDKAKADHPRILMFGDSYTAGDCVSNADRYSDQLARMLGVEVQNYGVSGTGTDHHLLIQRKFAREVAADLVMICVQIDSFHRIQVPFWPCFDRVAHRTVLVPKPYFEWENGELVLRPVLTPQGRPFVQGGADVQAGRRKAPWHDSLRSAYLAIPGLRALRCSRPFRELGSRAVSPPRRTARLRTALPSSRSSSAGHDRVRSDAVAWIDSQGARERIERGFAGGVVLVARRAVERSQADVTTSPPPTSPSLERSTMWRAAACSVRITPSRLVVITRRHSSSGRSRNERAPS